MTSDWIWLREDHELAERRMCKEGRHFSDEQIDELAAELGKRVTRLPPQVSC